MDDLKIIKKLYGEGLSHLCRELFPTILENEGALLKIITTYFAPSKFLYEDIVTGAYTDKFKNFVYSKYNNINRKVMNTSISPQELLSMAGYDLYECNSEEDIQSFRHYWAKGEELCTFTQGNRLKRCHVFFAIRKDIVRIKRENFASPRREDDYGVSAISIQFERNGNRLSIKNRYNHTVDNPDATFSNDLDNIIPGLTKSFEKHYNFKIQKSNDSDFEMSNYCWASDGKMYKYNYEFNNIYYCPNNIVITPNGVKEYPKEKYIVLDYFLIDLVNKKVSLIDNLIIDSFPDDLQDIKKIEIIKEDENKRIVITTKTEDNIVITIDKYSRIIGYENNRMIKMGPGFLSYNKVLSHLSLLNLKKMGRSSFARNTKLYELYLTKLIEMENSCFAANEIIKIIDISNLETMGYNCFTNNLELEEITLSKLINMGDSCFLNNEKIRKIYVPNLETMGNNCFFYDEQLEIFYAPKLLTMGYSCFNTNKALTNLVLQSIQKIGEECFDCNEVLTNVYMPNIEMCKSETISNILERQRGR